MKRVLQKFSLWSGCLFIIIPLSGALGEEQLAVSAVISGGTCKVSVDENPNIHFGPVSKQHFGSAGQTSEYLPLHVQLSDCGLIGSGGAMAAVQITGTPSPFDDALFLDAGSQAKGVGIMLRSGIYEGPLTDFYAPADAVKNGDYTYEQPTAQAMSDRTLDYTIGLTSGNGTEAVSAGDIQATLRFTFAYH